MIKDMVAKLEADVRAEQSQKGWCDTEVKKATEQRDEMIGGIEGDTATITKLHEEVAGLAQEVAELRKGLSEATRLRAEEHARNTRTVTQAIQGSAGVTQALKILKDFYVASFIETGARYVPPKADASGKTVGDLAPDAGFEGEYSGHQDASNGILGMLEVIKSDFERTTEATNTEESEAEEAFKRYKAETDSAISEKEDLVATKRSKQKQTKGVLFETKEDLGFHTKLKDQALTELQKLKPACLDTGSTYAEMVARREQEIESLKNAYGILDEMR